ncbi:MAG: hypothetical protein Q7S58_21420 [Candidatus Binatus sp.]|uniref:hypothetical protein n=1 Tax=Candidatus Binatus sp. TaxID=2811406 RepID=UPI00271939F4|nr:hypothetical protein [Candidatus Binatus sp.]MDO8434967.1 hypothetical protein [Candidatus Binatus sp.]
MAKKPIPQIVRIGETELRRLFNENYLPQIGTNKIEERVMRGAGKHPAPAPAQEPYCTESQQVSYRDPATGKELARAHRYVRPDGTLGASGKPDPKRVSVNDVLYRIIKQKNRP